MFYKNYEYFLTIAKYQSITKAADELYISQPALSNYLNRLEKKLGIALFDHSSIPLKLTFAGEHYLEYINSLNHMEKRLEDEFSEIRMEKRGKIAVGLSPWRASHMLPRVLPDFSENYPHINIQAEEGLDHELYNFIEWKKVDFSIKSLIHPSPQFHYEIIMKERILLAINIRHPILKHISFQYDYDPKNVPHFDLERARNERFIFPKPTQNLYHAIQEILIVNQIDGTGFETANVATALNLVEANFGITFVPEACILHSNPYPNIVFFTIGEPVLFWYLTAVYKKNEYLPNICRLLIEDFKKNYQTPRQ
mgnify:FL=1